MLTTYKEYLQTRLALPIEDMIRLANEISEEIGSDEEAVEIYDELMETATRYADFRANWFLWDRETKMNRDSGRTACHNSIIIKFNMLSRFLKMQGKPAAWRDELGYEEDDRYARKRIGDFACFLVFLNSINAR